MAMPPCGTFSYIATVPLRSERSGVWKANLREPIVPRGNPLSDRRLVGYSPELRISDGGFASIDGANPATIRCSCVALTGSNPEEATVAGFAFSVGSDLIDSLQPRDQLCMARTGSGGLGVSILRDNELIAAVGAVTAVPLGARVEAATRYEQWHIMRRAIRRVLRIRPRWRERPLKVRIGRRSRTLRRGTYQIGNYEVYVKHGLLEGVPGTDPCAAIVQREACPSHAAISCAELLGSKQIQLTRW